MLVSVIVASYNYEKYIRETLDSVLAQTHKDLELIVVDDGSKDNSVAVIKEYESKDKRVKLYLHEGGENKGLPETIKLALSKAKGKWIAFCETDDYWTLDHLEKKLAYAEKYPEAAIITNRLAMFGEDEKSVDKRRRFHGLFDLVLKHEKPVDVFFEMYNRNVLSTFSAIMVKRDVLMECDFEAKIPAWLDWWLWRQIAFGHKIGGINEDLTYWRVHPDSFNSSKKGKNSAKEFKKASNLVLKNRYGSEFCKRMRALMPRFVWKFIKSKSLRVYRKDEYVRVSLLGISFLKIKV